MEIAGGLYREICEMPSWDATFGSGGRAAAALAALSPGTVLHTYAASAAAPAAIEALGVTVRVSASRSPIVFAYFHPLSRPHIEPAPPILPQEKPLTVKGPAVLRFGMLEGSAVVSAGRAVHDPQTVAGDLSFRANGSAATELTIVLNEQELQALGGALDLRSAAARIFQEEGASVVIAKGGPAGATLLTAGGGVARIPAYETERVFKIGSGDVFTAVFSHLWAEAGLTPAEAADRASRATAEYCRSRRLPVGADAGLSLNAVAAADGNGIVLLLGRASTLASRWAVEEARWCLRALGAEVVCPALDPPAPAPPATHATLVLLDGLAEEALEQAVPAGSTVVFDEAGRSAGAFADEVRIDDFTTALYQAIWAARRARAGASRPSTARP